MIAKFQWRGKTAHSKVIKENDKTVHVLVPGKPCGKCNGKGVVPERFYRVDPSDYREKKLVGVRPTACDQCWGETPSLRKIKLDKADCVLIPCVPMTYPSPTYWAPARV